MPLGLLLVPLHLLHLATMCSGGRVWQHRGMASGYLAGCWIKQRPDTALAAVCSGGAHSSG